MMYQNAPFGYLIRIESGEELKTALTDFCRKHDVTGGFISGLGAVREARIGMYHLDRQEYDFQDLGPAEIASLTGNIAVYDDQLMLHLHAVLAGDDQHSLGGHLDSATVEPTCEIALFIAPGLSRAYEEKSGLPLWNLPRGN